jgi:hypothetical protein
MISLVQFYFLQLIYIYLIFGLKKTTMNVETLNLLGSPGFQATSTVSISSDFCRLEGLDDESIVPSLVMSSIASFEWIDDKEVCFWRAIFILSREVTKHA